MPTETLVTAAWFVLLESNKYIPGQEVFQTSKIASLLSLLSVWAWVV